jgi:hypothetical protein
MDIKTINGSQNLHAKKTSQRRKVLMAKRKLPKNWIDMALGDLHKRILAIEVTFTHFLEMVKKEKKLKKFMEKKGKENE